MDNPNHLLKVENLTTYFPTLQGRITPVDEVNFTINAGETLALLGESGSGKSLTALSLMQLLPLTAMMSKASKVDFNNVDLLNLSEAMMRKVRGKKIAMIFQEPMTSLNPVFTVGDQIKEVLRAHTNLAPKDQHDRIIALMDMVKIPDPIQRIKEYPHQLSGGMKQRVMIAMALAIEPDVLIADEPTTALDVTIQAQVLHLLKELQKTKGTAVLLITHDLGVVRQMADRIAVMYAGQIVELSSADQFFKKPAHPYSQKLFESIPNLHIRNHTLAVIPGVVPSLNKAFDCCRFADRCSLVFDRCRQEKPAILKIADREIRCHLYDDKNVTVLSKEQIKTTTQLITETTIQDKQVLLVDQLKVHFPIYKGLFKRVVATVKAVDGVSINLQQGKTLALVGESGCGKTTVGKAILQLIPMTKGIIQLDNEELKKLSRHELKKIRSQLQIIFQDPYSSLNPRMMVRDIIAEGLLSLKIAKNIGQCDARIDELLNHVGLNPETKYRYPHEFSGGQRQRICIARSLAVNPRIIICDEPTSALDVSVQAQILNLLKQLQIKLGLSYLFITHNISVVSYLAHDVAVMYLGRIVEQGTVEDILLAPQHPYTKALLAAVPRTDSISIYQSSISGELPSPINPPAGCYFHPRCPHVMDICKQQYPAATQLKNNQMVHCHLYK